jgi:hypothetical protein
MLKPLAWFAIIGFLLAAFFLGGAYFTRNRFRPWSNLAGLRGSYYVPRGPMGSKAWTLDSDKLDIQVAADVRMVPAPGPTTITVKGPQDLLDQLSFENGVLDGAEYPPSRRHPVLRIEIKGGPIRDWRMAVGRLSLGSVDQDRLSIHVEGAADIEGEGKVDNLDISIEGAGENDLGHLKARTAKVHIEGAGHAEIAPVERADITIDGAGLVELATKPKSLSTHLTPFIAHVSGPGSDDHDSDWEDK